MIELAVKRFFIEGKEMARLEKSRNGAIKVEPLPACSLGTYLRIIVILKELGYNAI